MSSPNKSAESCSGDDSCEYDYIVTALIAADKSNAPLDIFNPVPTLMPPIVDLVAGDNENL
jgi:hypothetical protein